MLFRRVCVFIAFLTSCFAAVAKDIVRLSSFPQDKKYEYKMKVLNTILSNTQANYGDYEIVFSAPHITVKRGLVALQAGEVINVFMAITTEDWENKTIPIRIPIRSGILSKRLIVSSKENLSKFESIYSIEEIQVLRGGMKLGWTTSDVLKQARFKVLELSSLDTIYKMISKGKVDYTLRGPNEVFTELSYRATKYPNLIVVPNLTLSIPAPYYIFVAPSERRLADRLLEGLEKMVADGSLKALFYKHYTTELRQADLRNRASLVFDNLSLPPLTPLDRKELWYFLDEDMRQ